jgi:hypothetical protein
MILRRSVYYLLISVYFDYTFVCHFINDGNRKFIIIIFQKSYLTFLSSDFIVEPKTKSIPGIFVQFFCCEESQNFFLKSGFLAGNSQMKKQQNSKKEILRISRSTCSFTPLLSQKAVHSIILSVFRADS